jgi:predicted kinase
MRRVNRATRKVLFYAGGPGSGKDWVAKETGYGHGLTEINSDHAFEHLLGREGLSKTMPPEETERRTPVRARAKGLTKIRQSALLNARRGVIINTTGHDPEKIKKMKDEFERRGYDTKMVFVNTSNDVSRQRNVSRGKGGGRTVPEETRQEYWNKAQQAVPEYKKMFGEHFHHVDNSLDLTKASDEEKLAKQAEFNDLHKTIRDWSNIKAHKSSW